MGELADAIIGKPLTLIAFDGSKFQVVKCNSSGQPEIKVSGQVPDADTVDDMHAAEFVAVIGDIMTGLLTLSGVPTADLHAATKKYADDLHALQLLLSGGTLTGALKIEPDANALDTLEVNQADTTPVLAVDTINARVGIGTPTPGAKLDVRDDSGIHVGVGSDLQITLVSDHVFFKNTTLNTDIYFQVNDGGVTKTGIWIEGTTSYVGIGAGPTERLDVFGNQILLGADNTEGFTTRTDNTNKVLKFLVPHYDNQEENTLAFLFGSISGDNFFEFGGGSAAHNAATYITFKTAPNATTLGGTERMRIDSAGNVGIGTNSPDTRLDIDAGAMEFAEMTAPGAGAVNTGRVYCKDNGAGKTQLIVVFSDGAEHVLATMA